jgi:hypothetical protein
MTNFGVISSMGDYPNMAAKCDVDNRLLVPLTASGNGSGVLTMRMTCSVANTVYITGNGFFYSDSAGTLGQSKTATMTANVEKVFYIRCASGSCFVVFENANALFSFGNASNSWIPEVTNSPILNNANIYYLTKSQNILKLITTLGKLSGQLLSILNCTYLYLRGNLMSVSGQLSSIPNCTYLYLNGPLISVTYSTRSWIASMQRIYLSVSTITGAMVDQILLDLQSSGTAFINEKEIYLAGRCGAHSSASDAAIAYFRAAGVTVTVN